MTATSVHSWYLSLNRPPGTPPNWLFGPVWSVLYALMAVAAWRVWRRPRYVGALRMWGWQLLANALWAPAFFGLRQPGWALGVMAVLIVLVGLTTAAFSRRDRLAALMLLPYLAWLGYAGYLNAGFWWLNR